MGPVSATALLELWPTPADLIAANRAAAARARRDGDHGRAARHDAAADLLLGGGRL